MKRFVSFQEDPEIVNTIDEIAKIRGINRSGFIRSCIRREIQRTKEVELKNGQYCNWMPSSRNLGVTIREPQIPKRSGKR